MTLPSLSFREVRFRVDLMGEILVEAGGSLFTHVVVTYENVHASERAV